MEKKIFDQELMNYFNEETNEGQQIISFVTLNFEFTYISI